MEQISGIKRWDSDFFGKKTGYINGANLTDHAIFSEIDNLQRQGCECIYLFSPRELRLDDYDAVLADKKVSYILDHPAYQEISEQIARIDTHPEALHNLALQSGQYSRYRIDRHFSDEEFQRLYIQWIDNSVTTDYADHVLSIERLKPVGMITAKEKEDEISIGLFATDAAYRGQGIGSRLIQAIINIGAEKGLKVEVTTQSDNLDACRFYERHGFHRQSLCYIYHIWMNNNTSENDITL